MFRLKQHLAKVIATAALGTLCGCTDEPVFEKLFSTDHFDYYLEQWATPPCDATGEWLERYYSANAKFLGAELPAGEKIEYHRVRNTQTLDWAGCTDASGCTRATTIYSIAPLLSHEVVHANASLLGDPPMLFQEGLAVVLGCSTSSDTSGPLDTSAPIETMLNTATFVEYRDGEHGPQAYSAAGSFVRYLLDTFGTATFLSFYAHTPRDASRSEMSDIFQKIANIPLEDALSDWRNMPSPLPGDLCLRLMECGQDIPDLTDGEIHPGCGPNGGFLSFQQALFRFHVTEGKALHAVMTPSVTQPQALTRVSFFRCEGGDVMGRENFTAGFLFDNNEGWHVDPARARRRFTLDVPDGDYVAWFSVDTDTSIQTVIESSSPMRNGCIPAAEPLTFEENEDVLLTSRWMERPCIGFWCPGHSWDVSIGPEGGSIAFSGAIINGEMPYAPDKVYVCSKPCPAYPDECEVVMLDPMAQRQSVSKQVFAPGTIVHIGAPLAPVKEHFSLNMRLIPPCNGRIPCLDPWHGPR